MVPKKLLAGLFALVVIFAAVAQEEAVFAPFVSQVEAEIRNNLIRLSWKDALDVRGPVYVYRSESPFSALAPLPVPVEVPYGTGSFLEEAENPGTFYYFVSASDDVGRKYTLPILNTNTVSVIVEPENVIGWEDKDTPPAVSFAPNIPVPGIDGITVHIEGTRVIMNFSGADSAKNLVVYRSLKPIRRQEDLLSAIIIRQRAGSPVIDYPLPGINYHYALLYEEDLSTGVLSIRPGRNTTGAVRISGGGTAASRDMPLPGLNLSSVPAAADFGSEPNAFSPAGRNERTAKKEAEVFPEDLVEGGAGEEYQLRSIVQGYFALNEWGKAAEEFAGFLKLPRTNRVSARAHFYLGQVYYFEGKPREALLEFLAAKEEFPADCNSWIEAVLGDFAGR